MIPPTRSSITPERRVWVVGAGRGSQCGAVAIAVLRSNCPLCSDLPSGLACRERAVE